jgi:hypothetical protein
VNQIPFKLDLECTVEAKSETIIHKKLPETTKRKKTRLKQKIMSYTASAAAVRSAEAYIESAQHRSNDTTQAVSPNAVDDRDHKRSQPQRVDCCGSH